MTTLQITLDDDIVARLRDEAAAEHVPVETVIAKAAIERAMRSEGISPEFEAITRELIETYQPLLQQLA